MDVRKTTPINYQDYNLFIKNTKNRKQGGISTEFEGF